MGDDETTDDEKYVYPDIRVSQKELNSGRENRGEGIVKGGDPLIEEMEQHHGDGRDCAKPVKEDKSAE